MYDDMNECLIKKTTTIITLIFLFPTSESIKILRTLTIVSSIPYTITNNKCVVS